MASENTDEEELQLLNIFPNEAWEEILGNVKEIQDYQKISSASPHLRARLLPRAAIILFPEVMKLLEEHDTEQLPETNQWIAARQVCHAWKEALDQVLQTQKHFYPDDDHEMNQMHAYGIMFDTEPLCVSYSRFAGSQEFTEFEEHFDPTHLASNVNPFLQRKVQFRIQDYIESPEIFFAACLQFLRKYGHHIWTGLIHVDPYLEPDNVNALYNRHLKRVLELMPNLRALYVGGPPFPHLENQVFPTLHHLEYLSVAAAHLPVARQLLQRNPQVQYVDAICSPVTADPYLELLPNLRKLVFSLWNRDQVQGLTNAQFASRVECLWVDMSLLEVAIAPVFRALERHFSGSLVELHLSLPQRENTGAATRLVLPNLRILHLEMEKPQQLDLLLPLKDTLEELHLAMEQKPSQRNCRFESLMPGQDEQLQVYKFWKEPKKSNIWKMFPKLKIIGMKLFEIRPKKYSCTRKEWQAEMEAKD